MQGRKETTPAEKCNHQCSTTAQINERMAAAGILYAKGAHDKDIGGAYTATGLVTLLGTYMAWTLAPQTFIPLYLTTGLAGATITGAGFGKMFQGANEMDAAEEIIREETAPRPRM